MEKISIKGMSCSHCVQSVTKALNSVPNITDVSVNLANGEATYRTTAPVDLSKIKEAVNKVGFDVD